MKNKILPKKIVVNNKMQKGYKYELVEPVGKNFDKRFKEIEQKNIKSK